MESMDLGSSPLPGGWLGWRNFDDLVLLGGGEVPFCKQHLKRRG